MIGQALAGRYGQPLALDLCFGCTVLWFDGYESLLLAPGSILNLFTLIHEHRGEQSKRPFGHPTCPQCRTRLTVTFDRQRHVQFRYWRCSNEHGRLITFVEFLREKDFVRPLAPAELADLRQRVKTVRCEGCGAAIDLERGSACAYCKSPVSMLDPKHVDQVVRDLRAAEEKRSHVDPTLPARLVMDRLAVDGFFKRVERESGTTELALGAGLVAAGIAAVVEMMSSGD
jgi:hypothetical protein